MFTCHIKTFKTDQYDRWMKRILHLEMLNKLYQNIYMFIVAYVK